MKRTILTTLLLLPNLALALNAPANMVPAGLNPGDEFYVIFASSTTLVSTFPAIASYNAHANTAADLSGVKGTDDPSITWSALMAHSDGTTQTTSLFAANTSAPIYNLNGDVVADNVADMFDGTLDNAIGYDQSGTAINRFAFTGFSSDGSTSDEIGTGSRSGHITAADGTWASVVSFSPNPESVYAVSPLLTAPGVAPTTAKTVPSSTPYTLAMLSGLLGFAVYRNRKKLKSV